MYIPHPCYDSEAHYKIGRIHLAVAPFCNIQCNYCVRQVNNVNGSRPGVAGEILTPRRALKRLKTALALDPRIRIVAIAGPGDPLANKATLETFALVKEEIKPAFPDLDFCFSTNGLALSDSLPALKKVGIKYLTVTINAVSPEIARHIYAHVRWKKRVYHGLQAAELLLERQLEGICQASQEGFIIKINTVFMPGINDEHMVEIAETIKTAGAYIMNIMPLIPLGKCAHLRPPAVAELKQSRAMCAPIIKQWYLCKQCRADAVGVPGEEMGGQIQQEACPDRYRAVPCSVCSH